MTSGCLVSWASRRASAAAGIAAPRSASCAALQACSASARASRPSRPWARRLAAESARNLAARSKAPTAIAAVPASRVAPASDSMSGPSSYRRSTTVAPRPVGVASARTTSSRGSSSRDLQPLGGRGHVVARRRARIGPPAPQGRAVQQLEGKIGVAVGARTVGADRQRPRLRGLARDAVGEAVPDPRHPGLLPRGQVVRPRLRQQILDEVLPPQLEPELGRPQQPPGPPPAVAQRGRPPQRRHGDDGRAAPLGPQRRRLEFVRHRLVRSDDRGRPVPHGPFRLPGQGAGQRGVRRLSLRHARTAGGWRCGSAGAGTEAAFHRSPPAARRWPGPARRPRARGQPGATGRRPGQQPGQPARPPRPAPR